MGLIRTGITAGAALGGIKMVTNHLEKRSSNASPSPAPAPTLGQGMTQVPVHPQCSCPYCPQNAHQYAQQGFGGNSNTSGYIGNTSNHSPGWTDRRGVSPQEVYGNTPPAYVGGPQGGQGYEQEKKSVEYGQR